MTNKKTLTCVTCPKGCEIRVEFEGERLLEVAGNACAQGEEYAREEIVTPVRVLPTTVRVQGGILPLVPVKTSKPIPRDLIFQCMEEIGKVEVEAPIRLGDVMIENILGTGADIVATRDLAKKENKNYLFRKSAV